jgi:hypothetical protein
MTHIWINLYKPLSKFDLKVRLNQIDGSQNVHDKENQVKAILTLIEKR